MKGSREEREKRREVREHIPGRCLLSWVMNGWAGHRECQMMGWGCNESHESMTQVTGYAQIMHQWFRVFVILWTQVKHTKYRYRNDTL